MIELQIGDRVQMGEGCGWNREGMFGTVFTIGPVVGFVDDRDLYGIRFKEALLDLFRRATGEGVGE